MENTVTRQRAQFPKEHTEDGEFKRQDDAFRGWVTDDGSSGYPAARGRYHVYVSLACPWAHRTIIVRKLKKLEGVIGMTVVDPIRDERGWAFREGSGHSSDPVNDFRFLSEAYTATDPSYRGRVTVPVLWDTVTKRMVSNSDDDIMRMFNSAFNRFTESAVDLYPMDLREEIDRLKVHCERIPRSLLRGKRARWKPCFFTSLHFEDSLQLAAGNFKGTTYDADPSRRCGSVSGDRADRERRAGGIGRPE